MFVYLDRGFDLLSLVSLFEAHNKDEVFAFSLPNCGLVIRALPNLKTEQYNKIRMSSRDSEKNS